MAPLIKGAASSSSAPESVVAAVIADEYGAQQRYYGLLDATQNVIIGSLPESFIEVDQYFDIKHKLLNALENDIGPANFKVRTALELAREQQHGTTESEPEDIDVSHIVDQLLTETGTVQATVLMIEKAHSLFGPYVKSYPKPWADAVYVSYFKQGSSYYQRFQEAHDFDPSHQPCPGTAGCRYEQHHDQIEQALSSK
jgi:hypothetical protein